MVSTMLLAQETKYLPEHKGKWIYTNENTSGEWFDEKFYKMDAGEILQYHKTTERLMKYFSGQPISQNPIGVDLKSHARTMYNHYDHERYPVIASERIKAKLLIQFCPLLELQGKTESFCDEVPYLDVITNYPRATYEPGMNITLLNNLDVCNKMLEMFYLPDTLMNLGNGVILYKWYYENRAVIAGNKRPYWIPVTTKEYIERTLNYYNESIKEGNTEQQMVLDALKKEIALVLPGQMNRPVYISNDMPDRPLLGICDKGEPGAKALCKFNPDYFDNTVAKTNVQLITITIPGHTDHADDPDISSKNVWDFIKGLDGKELLGLLDVN